MMQLPRQLINLIGALLVIAVLAAGVLVGAMPLYMESARIGSDADRATVDNEIVRAQLVSLHEQSEHFDTLSAEVDALREQIPVAPTLDDVFEIIARASEETGLTATAVVTDGSTPWTPQVGPLDTATIEAMGTAGAAPAATTTTTTTDDSAATPDTDAANDAASAEGGTAVPADPTAASPQQSVAVTITAKGGDVEDVFRFIELLGSGPRLLSIIHTQLDGADEDYTLVVNALAFVRTES